MKRLLPRVKNKDIASFIDHFERKINVRFKVSREPPYLRIEIYGMEIPLERAPSGLREVAPIMYYLKHIADNGYILIIEEPEAHLHLDMETYLIRLFAGIAMKGKIQVLVTTHSLHLVDELSNLLRLNSLSPDERRRLGYEEWERLSPEKLSVYHIKEGVIYEVKAGSDGLEETEIDELVRDLASEHANVERYFYSIR